MALLQNVIAKGTHAARPAAGSQGVLYYESDTYKLFRDSGSTWDELDLTATVITQGQLAQAQGGTGKDTSAATNGQLLIGKTSDNSLNLATITAGTGISVTNGAGAITIAASGSGAAMTQLSETILGSDTANFTFSSISGSYRNLVLTLTARTDQSSLPNLLLQLNTDTGSNYAWVFNRFNQTGAVFAGQGTLVTSIQLGYSMMSTATAGQAASTQLRIFDYARTSWFKNVIAHTNFLDIANGNLYATTAMGHWESTAAVTAVKVFLSAGNFKTGSVCTLWGEV